MTIFQIINMINKCIVNNHKLLIFVNVIKRQHYDVIKHLPLDGDLQVKTTT